MPKSIGAQIPVKGEIWWFLERKRKNIQKNRDLVTQIAIKL